MFSVLISFGIGISVAFIPFAIAEWLSRRHARHPKNSPLAYKKRYSRMGRRREQFLNYQRLLHDWRNFWYEREYEIRTAKLALETLRRD